MHQQFLAIVQHYQQVIQVFEFDQLYLIHFQLHLKLIELILKKKIKKNLFK